MPRCIGHDYKSRCIYHITFRKAHGAPVFGSLCGESPNYGISRSQLGSVIEKQIHLIPALNPALKILQYCIMPDHVHLLLFVTTPTEEHLGNYIGRFKVLCHQKNREITGTDYSIFEDDFYDCILYRSRSLNVIYKYIRENARRLAVRLAQPEFFRRVNQIELGGELYQAYGNMQLMDNPFKEQVVVHRADSAEAMAKNREQWLYTGANGGVLVSPFISSAEKAVRTEAEALGGRIILIQNEPFQERYKPPGHNFELCEAGRLLIIAPVTGSGFSRSECLKMNALAAMIVRN